MERPTPSEAFELFIRHPKPHYEKLQSLSDSISSSLPKPPSRIHTIAVIGLRGVGKSTLALMALADLGFTYLDVEKCISEHTKTSEAKYLQTVSVENYQKLQYELIEASLGANAEKNLIVVMPLTIINSAKLIKLLHSGRFSIVVNIECEVDRILNYMNYQGNYDIGAGIVREKLEQYRSLSTHDFFNYISDGASEMNLSVGNDSDFFMLKPVQRDFSRFLIFLICGPSAAWAYTGNLHLLSRISERFTNCLRVCVPNTQRDLEGLDLVGVDFVEIDVSLILLARESPKGGCLLLQEHYSRIRRVSRSSVPIIVSISVTREDKSDPTLRKSTRKEDLQLYFSLLRAAVALGADYLSLNLDFVCGDIASPFTDSSNQSFEKTSRKQILTEFNSLNSIKGSTQLIGTYHSADPEFWDTTAHVVVDMAQKLDLPILRLSSVAAKVSDNHRIHKFLSKVEYCAPNIRVCAYNTGHMGKLSRVLNRHMTPVNRDSDNTAHSLQLALNSCGLSPRLTFYVIGSNVSKSASPLLYSTAFTAMGLPHTFELYECSELQPHLSHLLRQPSFGGAAVLMPFKLSVIESMDRVSSHVKVIGAMNTIVADRPLDCPDKVTHFRGENTDWLGVKIALSHNISPINSARQNRSALVLGAGGMARSAIYALIQLGFAHIYLYNRTMERAADLASYFNDISPMLPSKALTVGEMCDSQNDLLFFKIEVVSGEELASGTFGTNLGMKQNLPVCIISCIPSIDRHTGKCIDVPIHDAWFLSLTGGTVLETNYVPLDSAVLRNAERFCTRGWVTVNGLTWLLCQIIAQFEMFTGKQAPVFLFKNTAKLILESYKNSLSSAS